MRIEKHTALEWAKIYGLIIVDPDGWRKDPNITNIEETMKTELIMEYEFNKRIEKSTCSGNFAKVFDYQKRIHV